MFLHDSNQLQLVTQNIASNIAYLWQIKYLILSFSTGRQYAILPYFEITHSSFI